VKAGNDSDTKKIDVNEWFQQLKTKPEERVFILLPLFKKTKES